MRQITEHVYQFEGLKSGQAYLIAQNNELTLIDTGTSGDYKKISSQMSEKGLRVEDVSTIILTHCHLDHTTNVTKIQNLSHATIISHALEKPYIETIAKIRYSSLGKNILWGMINAFFGVRGIRVDKTVKEGNVLDILGGLHIIHTPGHTPGSIALYQPERKILFSGDSLCNEGKLTVMQGIYNTDDQELLEAVQKFRNLAIDIICVGHGASITEKGSERIEEIL